jgi:A/G-specific adenine glycosylase
MTSLFSERLLGWYGEHARDLPWRGRTDPYTIWVSEVMLQQTRVETVIPYFERWMRRFPTLIALAQADVQEVLALWEGLGYYGRARNLHRAAQLVMRDYGGQLPADVKALRRLPGIGRYTAGAIASFAFGLDEPVLDGNVRRVLARVFDITQPLRSPEGERRLWQLAVEHLPPGRAADYNQALMDLGATLCTSRAPRCMLCPLAELCRARLLGVQDQRPVLRTRKKVPHHTVTAAIIQKDGRVLIARRPPRGLLGGLWEFPGGKLQPGEDLVSCLQREIKEELGVQVQVEGLLGVYRHAYTHFQVTLHAFYCRLNSPLEPCNLEHEAIEWVRYGDLPHYPMGKIDRQIARDLQTQHSTPLAVP